MKTYKLSDSVLYRKQEKTATLFVPSFGKIYSIDEVGCVIVDFLQTPKTVEQIEQHIQAQFDTESEKSIQDDIFHFVRELASFGIFEQEQ
jgi:Coenzyme PQQ synthesis protein D (PqqD)